MPAKLCPHERVICLNDYELIRKYRCEACHAVMMCACDERHGTRFLPHQLHEGQEYGTKRRIPVTLGFQPSICRECRGLPPVPCPKAAIHGHTSKIKRFYWRELHFRKYDLLAELGMTSEAPLSTHDAVQFSQIEARALEDIKLLHAATPKYSLSTESEAAFLLRVPTEIVNLRATVRGGGEVLRDDGSPCSSEMFAADWLRAQGYEAIECESTPIHAMFAVFLWTLVQDYSDPRVRTVMFDKRRSFEESGSIGEQVWTALPEDFGGPGYAIRRAAEINEFFSRFMHGDTRDLLFTFDVSVDGSYSLRQYLWAHREIDLERARQIVAAMSPDSVRSVLRYLLDDYWGRFLGWPDIFAWGCNKVLFVEVKLSGDKLSDEQRNWIEGNVETLHLPFKLLKIHKLGDKAG